MYILTARNRPDAPLQRAGHADLSRPRRGETYMVYLCGRPLPNRGRCTLGRETAIQQMVWGEDGWLRTDGRRRHAGARDAGAGAAGAAVRRNRPRARTSTRATLPIDFQWLRTPWPDELFSLTARPGSPAPVRARDDRQPVQPVAGRAAAAGALLQRRDGRRVRARSTSSRLAGLVCYYNSAKFHYLYVSHDDDVGQAPAGDVVAARPGAAGRVHGADSRAGGRADRIARGSRLRASALRATAPGTASGSGCRSMFDASMLSDEATRAGAAELHRRVRRHGVPGHGRHGPARRTSTTSSTGNASALPDPAR